MDEQLMYALCRLYQDDGINWDAFDGAMLRSKLDVLTVGRRTKHQVGYLLDNWKCRNQSLDFVDSGTAESRCGTDADRSGSESITLLNLLIQYMKYIHEDVSSRWREHRAAHNAKTTAAQAAAATELAKKEMLEHMSIEERRVYPVPSA